MKHGKRHSAYCRSWVSNPQDKAVLYHMCSRPTTRPLAAPSSYILVNGFPCRVVAEPSLKAQPKKLYVVFLFCFLHFVFLIKRIQLQIKVLYPNQGRLSEEALSRCDCSGCTEFEDKGFNFFCLSLFTEASLY